MQQVLLQNMAGDVISEPFCFVPKVMAAAASAAASEAISSANFSVCFPVIAPVMSDLY
jgi:hypothetical protein